MLDEFCTHTTANSCAESSSPSSTTPTLLEAPVSGVPPVITTQLALQRAIERLDALTGPVAIDTERASGIRYGQRAYLIQLKRAGTAPVLIDPIAPIDLEPLYQFLAPQEWVLHAATQDLPCLRELELIPQRIFDTELASRLAGYQKVGLASMVEQLLGYTLKKEYSSVNWSSRPLPKEWLVYAALDVEILVDLRDALEEVLISQGKLQYALEEFDYIVRTNHPQKPRDPWRKTKGIHELSTKSQLTVLRNLWYEREHLAKCKDIAPKRLLPDASLVQAARQMPRTVPQLLKIAGFQTRALAREAPRWIRAIARTHQEKDYVPFTIPSQGPPPLKSWECRRPLSLELIQEAKTAINQLSEDVNIPHNNILAPNTLRKICWDMPREISAESLKDGLIALDARPWQVQLTMPVLLPLFEKFHTP
ncbi:HRDC domain-containing protein [Rothia sp. P7181]|uniref:HRDC domain-containing protein n=1 Tax=Rothia sp. P7181 TaxID=3402663 RepID=UPI003AEA595E